MEARTPCDRAFADRRNISTFATSSSSSSKPPREDALPGAGVCNRLACIDVFAVELREAKTSSPMPSPSRLLALLEIGSSRTFFLLLCDVKVCALDEFVEDD